MQYYFEQDFDGKGPCVLVLAGNRWPPLLRRLAGIGSVAIHERSSLPHEVDIFPNGHPYAWRYRDATELLADERRWLTARELSRLQLALEASRALQAHGAGEPRTK